MPQFHYEAISSSGERLTGDAEGNSKAAVKIDLKRKGLQVFKISPAQSTLEKPSKKPKENSASKKTAPQTPPTGIKLGDGEVLRFTEELSDLLTAGLPLEQALRTLSTAPGGGKLADVAVSARENLREGKPLSQALANSSPSFDSLFLNLVAAGEKGGVLGSVLERQARYLKDQMKLQREIISALVYPGILILSGVLLSVIFIGFLVPRLMLLMQSTGGESSWSVRLIMGASLFINQYWWALIPAVILLFFLFVLILKSEFCRPTWERLQLRLPLLGVVLRRKVQVTYLETVANLLRNGINLDQALKLGATVTDNRHVRSQFDEIAVQVSQGNQSLSHAVAAASVFDHPAPDIIRVGEQTGDHATALARAATRFAADIEVRIARLTTAIQPAVLLIMAIAVLIIASLMLNVIYDSMNSIQTR